MRALILSIGVLLACALPAQAEVLKAERAGFDIRFTRDIAAPPAAVWPKVVQVGRWWSDEHTFSGAARNLTIDAKAGGCFCERWGANSVEHARVIFASPPHTLRLQGSLGPLQDMAAVSIMTFTLSPQGAGTRLTLTYRVASAFSDMTDLAPAVDGVLGQQFARLARYAETGAPQ